MFLIVFFLTICLLVGCGTLCACLQIKRVNRKLRQRQAQLLDQKIASGNYVERQFGDMNGFIQQENPPNRTTTYIYAYPKDYLFPRDAQDVVVAAATAARKRPPVEEIKQVTIKESYNKAKDYKKVKKEEVKDEDDEYEIVSSDEAASSNSSEDDD